MISQAQRKQKWDTEKTEKSSVTSASLLCFLSGFFSITSSKSIGNLALP